MPVQIMIFIRENPEKSGSYPKEAVSRLSVIQNAAQEMVDVTVETFTQNK